MHLSPPPPPPPPRWLRLLSVLRQWFCCCWLFVYCWESVIVLCFVVRCFVSVLVLQSSWYGRESWLLCLICLPGVLWWLSGSSSLCHRVVCCLWLWYFLIILTYYFWSPDYLSRISLDVVIKNLITNKITDIWSLSLMNLRRWINSAAAKQ